MVDGQQQQKKEKQKMKEENNKKPGCMQIDADLWRQFKACAVINGLKLAELVEKALIDEVKLMEGKENA